MKRRVKKVVFCLVGLFLITHLSIDGMFKTKKGLLKKKFETFKKYPAKQQHITPPSPISPVSQYSHSSSPKKYCNESNKLTNSDKATNEIKTPSEAIIAMGNSYQSITPDKKALTIDKEIDLYHSCRNILNKIELKNEVEFLEHMRIYNKLRNQQGTTPIPRVFAWAALDNFLEKKEISLEDILFDENLLKKLENLIGIYRFPTKYICDRVTYQPQKEVSHAILSHKEKIIWIAGNTIWLQDMTVYLQHLQNIHDNPVEKTKKLSVTTTKNSTSEIPLVETWQKLSVTTTKNNTLEIPLSAVLDPTGTFAAIYSPKGPITIWDVSDIKAKCIAIPYDDKPKNEIFIKTILASNHCKRLVIIFSDNSYIVTSTRKKTTTKTITKGSSLDKAAISPNGLFIAFDSVNKELLIKDYSEKNKKEDKRLFPQSIQEKSIYSIVHEDQKVTTLQFDQLSQYAAIATTMNNNEKNQLIFCDVTKSKNNQPILEWQIPNNVSVMAFSPSGKYMAIAYQNGLLHIYHVKREDGKKQEAVTELKTFFGKLTSLTFDKDETILFAATENGYNLALTIHTGDVTSWSHHKTAIRNGYFTRRCPLEGFCAIQNNNKIVNYGATVCNVLLKTYLLLRYVLPYQLIVQNPDSWLKKAQPIPEKAQPIPEKSQPRTWITEINKDLAQLRCRLNWVTIKKYRNETDSKQNDMFWISNTSSGAQFILSQKFAPPNLEKLIIKDYDWLFDETNRENGPKKLNGSET